MKIINRLLLMIVGISFASSPITAEEITPYKFTDKERQNGGPKYKIPSSSRLTTKRRDTESSEIVYYFSKPAQDRFPIAIVLGGSSSEDDIMSIIHVHRYFLKEFLDLGAGVITMEQRGVDGDKINKEEFMEHYTRSQRLSDHCTVIEELKKNPPLGWNGKFIFLGVSEGGPIVTTLTTRYGSDTLASINWSGAGDFSWNDELWFFMQNIVQHIPWYIKLRAQLPSWMPYSIECYCPSSYQEHTHAMAKTIKNPTARLKIAGMTYKYHNDALMIYPRPAYEEIKTPYLVVAGEKDSIIDSADAFVEKARLYGAPITYRRVSEMDHYIRKREDIINDSFAWLKGELDDRVKKTSKKIM